ncbi:hypothetical protein BUALT_Bualt06G0056300 [Buddleja alternifolia]|uniref:Uncharacterized protein n=1 Tax=Buddleja alternifolia TaxID=168488 RepID=A0AAV6XJY9_9LAMI|nr:hypothetical protein BUALT_Bualt06G0056300 [Buddleja alternifolia]
MPIPGSEEQPGAVSRPRQSINFSSAIPIKKRRFPIIQPESPPQEEKQCNSDDKKRESNIPDEEQPSVCASSITDSCNSDVSKISASIVGKDEVTPKNIILAQANVDPFESEPQEAKPSVSLGPKDAQEAKPSVSLDPKDELKNKVDILLNEKSTESEARGRSVASLIMNVKQEIPSGQSESTCRPELSAGAMNIELSIGPQKPLVPPALEQQNSECIGLKSDKLDPSLLSLSLSKEKPILHENAMNNVSSVACSNRSNWDLNTTMDAWESSTDGDAFAHRVVDIGRSSKTNSIDDVMTTAGTVDLSLNKGKNILDEHRTNSSNASVLTFQQGKTDDSVGLRLGMPYRELDFSRESSALSNKLTSVGPNLNLQQVQLSAMNLNIASARTVKSEPVDENSKHDSSIGSRSSSSNMGLSKFSSVKREFVENLSRETLLPSSVSPDKLFDPRSIKSELVLPQSVGSVMQHQESCASSSTLSVLSMPQNSFRSKLSTCSELTVSGDLSNRSEHSFHSEEVHDHNDIPDGLTDMVSKHVSQESKPLKQCNVENSNVKNPDKCEIGQPAEHTLELCGYKERAANDEEKISISAEIIEDDFCGSDFKSHENCDVDTCMDVGEKISHKEDEYEDGEIREPLQPSSGEDHVDKGKTTENVERECDSRNLQPCVHLGDQDAKASEFSEKAPVSGNHDDTVEESAMIGYEPHSEDNSFKKLSDVFEVGVDEKRCISVVTPEKQLDLSGIEDVEEGPNEEVSSDTPTNGSHGIGPQLGDEATDKVVKEICSEKHDLNSNNVEASVNGGNAAAKDSNNVGNKSRIINLSRASVVTTPCKTKPVPNRWLASRSGKERCSGPDGEIQPRGYRDEVHTGGLNKYAKDREHDNSFRNSRPSFTRGRGRGSGRFGSSHREWDSNREFASETYTGQSDYRPVRHKHTSSISDVDRECNGYDGTSFGGNRRKPIMNDEFPLSRRTSFRRLSPGDRDGPVNRGNQMLRRIPRNISPSRCDVEDSSNLVGFQHGDKFVRHLPDDMIDPVYARPQAIYEEVDDGQQVRGNRNFSTMQRKGYPRIRSKSPIRSRTRSPGPRRRSPNGLPELNQYRMGRMRSPERACFRDEMTVSRRRGGSPSFVSRHPNDLRDIDSGREHFHPRPVNFNRRSSPARVLPASLRRGDAYLRELGDGDEYVDGPPLTNKFRGDGSIDDRRKFIERQRPVRSFRPSYNSDGDNFPFHSDDGGPRPYRFCPDVDTEFVERSNMREREFDGREREFDGRVKHQPLVPSRRIRNIEEQQDGNYRPGGRVWHDDGFSDVSRGKRRRF